MSLLKIVKKRENRRTHRVRNKQSSRGLKPRVSVFKSLNHISVQIIDDKAQKTIVSLSTSQVKGLKGDKKEKAKAVGIKLAQMAIEKSVKDVFFDRGGNLYHGRVKALAEGLREGGLKF
jgi:large subunit ribosomal protein L18